VNVEAGRRALVKGLEDLFKKKEREALNAGCLDDALAIAVAGRLLLGIVNSRWEWFSLLAGDGVVDIPNKTFGFSAKYAEVAEVVLRLLAVWAGAYGAEIRVEKEKGKAMFAHVEDAAKVLEAVLKGEVLEYATSLARSWNGLAGSNAPKVVSLLALAQLLGVVKEEWAVELWLAHKAAATPVEPEVAQALDKLFARVEGVGEVKWGKGSVSLSFKVRGLEGVSHTVTLKLNTNFAYFRLSCDSCDDETPAGRVLETVAEWLRPAVELLEGRLRLVAVEWPKWHGDALELPAGVGWAVFLRLWARRNVSLRVEKEGRELLRVEVLEARADGTAKFRLWYYKWRETRPDRPYVDVEITHKEESRGFICYVYANEAKGIFKEHLREIAELLKREGVKGVLLVRDGKELRFSGRFRDSVLTRLGIRPELPPGEPPAVQYLGGLKFKVGDREVEFGLKAVGARRELYAELRFLTRDEAERFASSLKAIGVDARIAGSEEAGYTVRLDRDSFFGLLAATNAAPPGLALLYSSEEGDFRVYAAVESSTMRFYFTVKHGGVWRAVEGLYEEGGKAVELWRKEREVLEAVRSAVAKALGRSADAEEPKEERNKEGKVMGYYLQLRGHHLVPFLEHAADRVEAKPAEMRLEGRRIVISAGDVKVEVKFELLKSGKAIFLMARDVEQTLALYKSLKEVGVPVEITPKGVKIDGEAMWVLVAVAVERSTPSALPAEVMPGVELLKVYNTGSMKLYIFRAEGLHYYFAVKAGQEWRVAGGKYRDRFVIIAGKAVHAIADAINAIYREIGAERSIEVKYDKEGTPYIQLTNVDLRLLGVK